VTLPVDQRDALGMVGRLFLLNGYPARAATLFAALAHLDPGQPVHQRALALAYARAGQADKALAVLERLTLGGAVDAGLHALRAQVLGALGRQDEAAAAMQAFMALRRAGPQAAGGRA
jgi:predicted Zn-dependent protease